MTEVATLQQSFEHLALEKRPRLLPPDRSKPPGPAQYPALPDGFESHERYYVLGWKIGPEWFGSFTKRYFPGIRPFRQIDFGYLKLKALMGYKHLWWMTIIQDDDPIPESPDDPRVTFEDILVISVTASDYLLNKRRPTQAQYEWLVNLMGEEPMWHRDALPKEEFDNYYGNIY